MIDFLNRLFGRQSSGATAKERLRLVLMSDHLSLAPEMIDAMKRDFVEVISKYVEVDRDRIDVHFEHQDKALAMMANIPITGVGRNASGENGHASPSNGHASETREAGVETVAAEPAPADAAIADQAAAPSAKPKNSQAPRNGARRRRKKSAQAGGQAGKPATAS